MTADPAELDQVQFLAQEMERGPEAPSSTQASPATATSTPSEPATSKPWKGKYPNPWVDDYSDHPIAIAINTYAQKRGPAEEMKLGDAWAATVDYYMHTSAEVHPGYIALGTTAAFAAIAIATRNNPPTAPPAPSEASAGDDDDGGIPHAPSYP